MSIKERLSRTDWADVEGQLRQIGHAQIPEILKVDECRRVAALYSRSSRFRTTIDMERYRFGIGEYRYFNYPLPRLVQELRTGLYSRLAPIANRWMKELRRDERYPPGLRAFLAHCHARGQTRPTPLLLHYVKNGYNCLHRDLYGDAVFPLQCAVFLSRPEIDYGGGEFLLLERRARAQSRGEALRPEQGTLIVFPSSDRPAQGKRGIVRAEVRHGVSRLHWGERTTLGIIFHDST